MGTLASDGERSISHGSYSIVDVTSSEAALRHYQNKKGTASKQLAPQKNRYRNNTQEL